MANFDLASVLKDAGAQMGTGREQIEYIDIDKIDADANNFYAMSGISALMANIELIGLQQPIRVRPNPDAPGRYIVVSGHRRLTAFKQLRDDKDGGERWATIPAIVEACADSADLQELRLIYANADTRKISDFELRKQAERVEELLYKLKEQGVEFPGRMRDHVAEACKISKSKLGRLKQIKDGLAPDISRAYYETGKLPETTALALSRLPVDDQRRIIDRATAKDCDGVRYLYESTVTQQGNDFARWRALECPACAGAGCINPMGMRDKLYAPGYRGYSHCASGCCYDCPELASCAKSCLRMQKKKQAAKAEAKAAKAEEKAAAEAADAPVINRLADLWTRMGTACNAAGVSYDDVAKRANLFGIPAEAHDWLRGIITGLKASSVPPTCYTISLRGIASLIEMADALDVSLDDLLGRTDTMQPPTAELCEAAPQWQTGDPPEPGLYAVRVDDQEYSGWLADSDVDITRYTGERWIGYGAGQQCRVVGWWPIPGEEGGDDA